MAGDTLETIRNFFALRPAFTRFGIKALWFAFLFEFIFRYGNLVLGTLHVAGNSAGAWYSIVLIALPALLNLILIRLALEVAERLLFGAREG